MRLSRTVSLLKMWQSWSFLAQINFFLRGRWSLAHIITCSAWHSHDVCCQIQICWQMRSAQFLSLCDTNHHHCPHDIFKSAFPGRCDGLSPSFSPSQLDKNDHWHTLHDDAWWNNIWKIDTIKIRFAGRCQHQHSQVTFSLVVGHTNFQHLFTYLGIGKITFLQIVIIHANASDSCNSYHLW